MVNTTYVYVSLGMAALFASQFLFVPDVPAVNAPFG